MIIIIMMITMRMTGTCFSLTNELNNTFDTVLEKEKARERERGSTINSIRLRKRVKKRRMTESRVNEERMKRMMIEREINRRKERDRRALAVSRVKMILAL